MIPVACRVAAIACASVVLVAQESLPPQFRYERPVTAFPGANRLAIDVPVLVDSQPFTVTTDAVRFGVPRQVASGGLGDLRLLQSGTNQEIPYLIVPAPAPADVWTPARVLQVAPTKKTSGFEADAGEPMRIDRVRIDGLPSPFLKRVMIEASGDRARWTVLAPQATLFSLPEQRLEQTEVAFTPGVYQYVRATWDDTNSAVMPLPRSVSVRKVADASAAAPPLTTTVTVERVASEPGFSRYRVRLPGARLPIVAVEPRVDAPYVFRDAVISESRLTQNRLEPTVLGRGQLRRVVRDDLVAASMAVPIAPPVEPELDLTIRDGDNPPLPLTDVVLRFADLPWVYFEHSGGGVVARWGDRQARAPRYDLEAARTSIVVASVLDATWGEVRPLTPPAAALAPAPLPNAGAPIEIERFRYNRAIPGGEAGLIAVPLDAAVLAHSTGVRTGFADLRIADANRRQVPYLLEHRDEPLVIDTKIEKRDAPAADRSKTPSRSFYRVRLPFANLPASRLTLTTGATVFDRQVVIGLERSADVQHRDPWVQTLTFGRWIHSDRTRLTPALTLDIPHVDATDLLVIVEEGDNSPLPIASARLLLPSYRVRLYRDAGAQLRLLYGHGEIGPPSYDLALLTSSVMGAPARDVAAEAEQPFDAGAQRTGIASPRVFWSVLIVAVIALLAILARLVRTT